MRNFLFGLFRTSGLALIFVGILSFATYSMADFPIVVECAVEVVGPGAAGPCCNSCNLCSLNDLSPFEDEWWCYGSCNQTNGSCTGCEGSCKDLPRFWDINGHPQVSCDCK